MSKLPVKSEEIKNKLLQIATEVDERQIAACYVETEISIKTIKNYLKGNVKKDYIGNAIIEFFKK